MRRKSVIGLLWSTEGTYQRLGQSSLAGALHALEEINQSKRYGFELQAIRHNPKGEASQYSAGADRLLRTGIRHIFGATTSSNRKDLIPDLQQHDALLWYSCSYEGFESSENVLYLGACPNQALLPLLRYAIGEFGKTAFLIGSNYVWGWESNRITREVLQVANGEVLGERYFHLGSTEGIDELVQKILRRPPAFVLNNLVGESSYVFLKKLDSACATAQLHLPVLSYDLIEAELAEIGEIKALRLFTAGPYFEEAAPDFSLRQRTLHKGDPLSYFYTGAYASIQLFAQAYQACGSDDPALILQYLHRTPIDTAMGKIQFSARNHHSPLPCHIAELQERRFRIIRSEPRPIEPDPYLTATNLREFQTFSSEAAQHRLRIVK
jgi:ABC-type branched-subunit amino acid transport system substrate-binding protein